MILISELIKEGILIVPIPGVTSFVTLLSISGLILNDFLFIGFLPIKKSKRLRVLSKYLLWNTVLILYESPYRVIKLIEDIKLIIPMDTRIVIGRELTKKFEQIFYSTIKDLSINQEKLVQKGEYTILIDNRKGKK